MAKYDFKSVGENYQSRTQQRLQRVQDPPIGIKTPIELGDSNDGLLKMHRSLDKTIEDNFRSLLLTNWGERLMDYRFGANLKELTFELGDEDFDNEAISRVSQAVARYLSFIQLQTFEPFNEISQENSLAKVGIRITYSIPQIDNKERKIEVILYAAG
jgi:phage baseplate assembly protein W